MNEFLTILIALWTYPIIGFLLFKLTKKRIGLRKEIFKVIFIISGIAILGLLTKFSTTNAELDWIIITLPFLAVIILLWWTQFQTNRIIKITGIIAMVLVFSVGYFSGTVGILGVGFVVGEFETNNEIWFDNGLIYKETSLGNAISDYRGKRIEINRTIKWLPLIEWQILSKEYFDFLAYGQQLNVVYDKPKNEFLLSAKEQLQDSTYYWTDTIRLEK
jgi:hypothetical protein